MLTYHQTMALREQLVNLRLEHRELDEQIQQLILEGSSDQLMITRLKRKKLQIKDQIARISSQLIPDLNA